MFLLYVSVINTFCLIPCSDDQYCISLSRNPCANKFNTSLYCVGPSVSECTVFTETESKDLRCPGGKIQTI